MEKTLFVTGTFDDFGGKKSKLGETLFNTMGLRDADYMNGGHFSDLEKKTSAVCNYDLIFWFANIANDKDKLVRRLKSINNAVTLVTSKRNFEKQYTFHDLVYHALNNKSNLFVEITKPGRYEGRIIDVLGNVFLDYTSNFEDIALVLKKRAFEIANYTRVKSMRVGNKLIANNDPFCEIIRDYAAIFDGMINPKGDAVNRFMGNASFRCSYGFPSFRCGNLIFVSRRNIEKKDLTNESFVAVNSRTDVEYFGNFKPSVDTPIHLGLYNYYSSVNYMVHSHVYVSDAPFTNSVIPCGATEELDDIVRLISDRSKHDFAVNLKGHGSIILARGLDYFSKIKFIPRPMPEIHQNYLR